MPVDTNPDLTSLRPYVKGRIQQLQQEAPDHLVRLKEQFVAEHGPTDGLDAALADSERVGWWLHHCAEWRLNKLRYLGRASKNRRRR